MNTLAYDHNLARVTSVEEGRVELAYDLDRARWPWLALPARHPVLLEKYQYFSAMTGLDALEAFEPGTFTALTQFSWECPDLDGPPELATHGVCVRTATGFELGLSLADGRELVRSRGSGFAFTDRDFKTWRARSREKARTAAAKAASVAFAPVSSVSPGLDGRSLVSALETVDGRRQSLALVSTDSGFHPAHPFHTGSGDHVNAGHLFDAVLQVAHLVLGATAPLECVAGAAEFFRFVELDVPFTITLADRATTERGERELRLDVGQLGRDNARIILRVR